MTRRSRSRPPRLVVLSGFVLALILAFTLAGALLYIARHSSGGGGGESSGARPPVSGKLAAVPDVSKVQGELLVYFLDVTLGDAIYVRLPDGQNLVIDGGDSPDELSTFLDFIGEKSIDVVVASHPHEDHIAGLARVIREREVKQVWTDGEPSSTKVAKDLDAALAASNAEKHIGKAGDKFELGGVLFRFLAPTRLVSNVNDDSLVLRMDCGPSSYLFTGDAELTSERAMIASEPEVANVDVLKLGHHGSRSSTSSQFLAVTKPRFAVYEAELNNPYGHPHKETLDRLAAAKVPVFGTGRAGGTVVIATACDDQFQVLEPVKP